jgi:hypothetical protein
LQSSLHVFGGVRLRAAAGAQAVMRCVDRDGETVGDAVTVRTWGQGCAIAIGADLLRSILHIQQGTAVTRDGVPAPDGSAPLNDGVLKAEDGHVLDWERDRIALDDRRWVFFGQPIADELRALLLQAIFFAAQRQRLPLPVLWFWADGLPAVGLISHDTDGNDPELGRALLETVRQWDISTTWCVLYPGGYPQSLYRAIRDAGGEIALHFDAFSGTPLTTWSKRNLFVQWQWLKDATGVAAVSNKNHYTRWQGRLEFFRWCTALGVRAEQSKGPSKRGTIGFLFGGSHPWRPLDDEGSAGRFLPVVAINLFSQDMVALDIPDAGYFHPAIVPVSVGEWLLRQTVRMGGVAHFLFHPAHIRRPGVRAALERLIAVGHELGVRWWTSAQIADWLDKRRAVRQQVTRQEAQWVWRLEPPAPLGRVALLRLLPSTASGSAFTFYGFPFARRDDALNAPLEISLPDGIGG